MCLYRENLVHVRIRSSTCVVFLALIADFNVAGVASWEHARPLWKNLLIARGS